MEFSDAEILALRPGAKEEKFTVPDISGLYLVLLPTGSLSWRLRLQLPDGRTVISLGRWPSLKYPQARALAICYKELASLGRTLPEIESAIEDTDTSDIADAQAIDALVNQASLLMIKASVARLRQSLKSEF